MLMHALRNLVLPIALLSLFASCKKTLGDQSCEAFDFGVTFQGPVNPPDNCATKPKVQLGRFLFYEKQLSRNQTQSCATCHQQKFGFAEPKQRAIGSTGQIHPRNTPGLANIGYFTVLTWSNPLLTRLSNQALVPILGETSATTIEELAMGGHEDLVASRLSADQNYKKLFLDAFGNEKIDVPRVSKALEIFQLTFISHQSAYDSGKLSESATRGKNLFFSERVGCGNCHSGLTFAEVPGAKTPNDYFANVGLYNISGTGDYPDYLKSAAASKMTQGLSLTTGNPKDRGRFRIPSLRNVSVTGPYMHDGSVATLTEVIDIFDAGGRSITSGPFAGDGRLSPVKDIRIRKIGLSDAEKSDLLEFLKSLTDECFINNPRLSDPHLTDQKSIPVLPAYCES